MAVIITKQELIQEYFDSERINQSTLKDLKDGLNSFLLSLAKKKKDKEEGKPTPDYFLIGGAVDTLLTGEKEEFEKKYYVSPLVKKPSDVEMAIIESVFLELASVDTIDMGDVDFEDNPDAILAAANELQWQGNWKDETRINKIIEKGTEYFEDLKKAFGKEILSSEMRYKIDMIVNSLRYNPKTSKYFDREVQASLEHMDFYYQLPIYFTHMGVECKALMDLVVVHKDEEGRIIKVEPIDLKTMSGDTLQFGSKIKQHRYDIQAAWYVLALTKYFGIDESLIEPFKFIVESTTNVGTPLVYRISKNTLKHGVEGEPEGYFLSEDGKRKLHYPAVPGYRNLMADYKFYEGTDWKEDKLLASGDAVLEIDWTKGILS